jgi:hypothetical protein
VRRPRSKTQVQRPKNEGNPNNRKKNRKNVDIRPAY